MNISGKVYAISSYQMNHLLEKDIEPSAVTERRTKQDWAVYIKEVAETHCEAEKIILIMDNLNTHKPSSLYETFSPEEAKALWDRFEFIYTPKHGSWLNMAEIELNVLNGQCLNRRIDNIEQVKQEVQAWETARNGKEAKINWQFTNKNARIKLKHLYPKLDGDCSEFCVS